MLCKIKKKNATETHNLLKQPYSNICLSHMYVKTDLND